MAPTGKPYKSGFVTGMAVIGRAIDLPRNHRTALNGGGFAKAMLLNIIATGTILRA
jgi:hypothetical protein